MQVVRLLEADNDHFHHLAEQFVPHYTKIKNEHMWIFFTSRCEEHTFHTADMAGFDLQEKFKNFLLQIKSYHASWAEGVFRIGLQI